jgi:hypothetical protein
MKTYTSILIGIAVVAGIVGGYSYFKKHKAPMVPIANNVTYKVFSGSTSRWFEGASTLYYSFEGRATATTTNDMNGAYMRVVDGTTTIANVFLSFEGARGLTPLDYISEIVAPHVSVIDPMGTTTVGAYDWTVAETPGSNWYITQAVNDNWLVVVEGKKTLDADLQHVLQTIKLDGNKE